MSTHAVPTPEQAAALKAQWQRLILPPDGIPLKAGRQSETENRYPDAEVDWAAHLRGDHAYAVNLAWTDPDTGLEKVKAGVIDIDEGEASAEIAGRLVLKAEDYGLSAAVEWSGGKGCHVWILSTTVAATVMKKVLRKLKTMVPHKGETIPGENARVKLAPCRHQVAQAWAYFYDIDGRAPVPLTDTAITETFWDGQVAILSDIEPTPAAALRAFVEMDETAGPRRSDVDVTPDLFNLGGAHPPCITSFLESGGSPDLGTYDRNNLTLRRYCQSAGMSPDDALALAEHLADNTTDDLETTKDRDAKLRHWHSTENTPSGQIPFRCPTMLRAKKSLGFDCGQCAVRPAGVRVGAKTSPSSLLLEQAITESLLAHCLKHGAPAVEINTDIFPVTDLTPEDDRRTYCPLYSLVYQGVQEGVQGPAMMARWAEEVPISALGLFVKGGEGAAVRRLVTQAVVNLVDRLATRPEISDTEAQAVVDRAVDLGSKLKAHRALTDKATELTVPGQDLLSVVSDIHEITMDLQRGHGVEFGAPVVEHAAELLEDLIGTAGAAIETPFAGLNWLLGGGLKPGKFGIDVAPPGWGKTTVAAQIADHAARSGVPVAFVAMEMGMSQLFQYALAREAGINSWKLESRRYSEEEEQHLEEAATTYFREIGPYLTIIEGDHSTTAAKLEAWTVQARARYGLTEADPVLIVIDYLQLLNTGIESIDNGPSETPKVSEVAVQLKQLARRTNAAVLAISDTIKTEQSDAMKGSEITLNSVRGSNRAAHAADYIMALYSEQATTDGGKAKTDPWDAFADKLKGGSRGIDIGRDVVDAKAKYPAGGDGHAVYARIELLKNRGGHGRGDQLLVYERAYHRFIAVDLPSQQLGHGRG